jgi:hypothetical protein
MRVLHEVAILGVVLTLASTPVLAGGKGGGGNATVQGLSGIKGESQDSQHKGTIQRAVPPPAGPQPLPYPNTSTNRR